MECEKNKTQLRQSQVLLKSNHQQQVAQLVEGYLNRFPLQGSLTVGIELEFFLKNAVTHELCQLDQSQIFLQELAHLNHWRIHLVNPLSGKILRVSQDNTHQRYHQVKYEHPPHLMEIAFAYTDQLVVLEQWIESVWNDLQVAADRSGVIIDLAADKSDNFLKNQNLPWEQIGLISNAYQERYQSRASLVNHLVQQQQSQQSFTPLIAFPSFVAATQYHIGGDAWWKRPLNYMESLYRDEFLIGGLAYEGEASHFLKRWSYYQGVFEGMSLLGFPDIATMNFDVWIEHLLTSPLSHSDQNLKQALGELQIIQGHQLESESIMSLIQQTRDLQIIKPKWIGTLEYRSDPATSNFKQMIKMAALRLASHLKAVRHTVCQTNIQTEMTLPEYSFKQLSQLWWQGKAITDFKTETDCLLNQAFDILKARNLGEERYL